MLRSSTFSVIVFVVVVAKRTRHLQHIADLLVHFFGAIRGSRTERSSQTR